MFNQIIMAVLGFLGISAFAKDTEGKSVLMDAQKEQLKNKYGEKFLESFMKDLQLYEKEGKPVESAVVPIPSAEQLAQQAQDAQALTDARTRISALETERKEFEAKIAKLEKEPAADTPAETKGEKVIGNVMKFKPDMKLGINNDLEARFNGRPSAVVSGDTTITTDELKKEFGRYVSAEKNEIFRSLIGVTSSTQYMSTMVTDKFKVRASHAHITSVLQSFVPKWTAKGAAKFTPLEIEQYPMKINVEIIPSDIIDDVLGYLYDEKLEPKDMPIVRYIVEQLVKPILDEERETALAKGRYVEPVVGEDGKYTASEATAVMTGYLTQLCDQKRNASTQVNFLLTDKAELGTGTQLLADIDKFVDNVAPLYKAKTLFIHADPDVITAYGRAYRDKYPTTKNQDGDMIKVDFSKFTFAPLEGMRGTGAMFITPKENFRHLMSQDPKNQSLRMTTEDYMAKIFGEWREGVGFWIQEAIFAYLPTALVDELSPAVAGSGSGSQGL